VPFQLGKERVGVLDLTAGLALTIQIAVSASKHQPVPVTEAVLSNAQEMNYPGNFREPCRYCTQTAPETTVAPLTQAIPMKQIMNYARELPA
jgi:hypothetical protein